MLLTSHEEIGRFAVLDVSDDDAMRILARMSRGCYAKNGPVELKLNRAQEWQLGMSVNVVSYCTCNGYCKYGMHFIIDFGLVKKFQCSLIKIDLSSFIKCS